ncbi:MAG: helix-turn-helix domain-containing protein [Planctomycetes bacterium]|jgi:DNA-binding Xre family transcriptional regulator|nr:helix-turn-helix domain-containing protein [Planctomycetota bacterium]
MSERQWKSVRNAKLTPEQKQRVREGIDWAQANRDEITRIAAAQAAELDALESALRSLKAARQRKGLSLGEVAARSGIDKANLSRLENDPHPNPTWSTLSRLAAAIGVRLDIIVRDAA